MTFIISTAFFSVFFTLIILIVKIKQYGLKYKIVKNTIKNSTDVLRTFYTIEERTCLFFWTTCNYEKYEYSTYDVDIEVIDYEFNTEQEAIEKINAWKEEKLLNVRYHEKKVVKSL